MGKLRLAQVTEFGTSPTAFNSGSWVPPTIMNYFFEAIFLKFCSILGIFWREGVWYTLSKILVLISVLVSLK